MNPLVIGVLLMLSREAFSKKQIVCVNIGLGEKMSISNDNIVVKDKDAKVVLKTTMYRLFAIFVIGHTTLTTKVIANSKKFKFSICFFSPTMKLYDIIGARMEGNFLLREKQYSYNSNYAAKEIIANKIENQLRTLKKVREKSPLMLDNIKQIEKIKHKYNLEEQLSIQQIMGFEGAIAKLYFAAIFEDKQWKRRIPRIKFDYINASLDIGYTLLFNYIDAILNVFGFDTYKGVLHQEFYMRKSLVCDIVEPLRTIIDWKTRKAMNLNQITEDDFTLRNNQYTLDWKQNRKYTKLYLEAILDNKDKIFHYVQSYYRAFMKGYDKVDFPKIEV